MPSVILLSGAALVPGLAALPDGETKVPRHTTPTAGTHTVFSTQPPTGTMLPHGWPTAAMLSSTLPLQSLSIPSQISGPVATQPVRSTGGGNRSGGFRSVSTIGPSPEPSPG